LAFEFCGFAFEFCGFAAGEFCGFAAAGEPLGAAEPAGASPVLAGAALAAGDGCCEGDGTASGSVDCNTDCEPVSPGRDNMSAISMNAAAAPIVSLAKTLAVPRGPNAALERLLENRSPAPDLPG